MEEYRHSADESIQRVKPKLWDPRWYYLNELLKSIKNVGATNMNQNMVLLDFGCGAMPYKIELQKNIKEYIGADLSDNNNATVKVSNLGILNYPDCSVDIVLSTQVLEHVPDPSIYLSECYRVLKPGGQLVLTTHGYWMYHPDPTDFWRWTSSGLQKIVKEKNFNITSFEGILGRAAMGLQLFQDGVMFKIPKIIRPLFILPMQLAILLFDKLEKSKYKKLDACTFILIAKK